MLTPYQFASNTPIGAIDLDGLEAYITTKCTPDGTTLLTINIDLQIKNSTELPAATIRQMGDGIKAVLESELKGYNRDTKTKIETKVYICYDDNAQFDNNPKNLNNDYFIDFVSKVKVKGSLSNWTSGLTGSDAKGADYKDWIGNTDFNRMQVQLDKYSDLKSIARTGAHEVLHSLGIYHPGDPENDIKIQDNQNLAYQSIKSSGTNVTTEQINRIVDIISGIVPNLNGRYNTLTLTIQQSDAAQKQNNNSNTDNGSKKSPTSKDP
jgi:hypothetical protein